MSRLTMIAIMITVIGTVSILRDYAKDRDEKEDRIKGQLYEDFLKEIEEIDFEGPRLSYNDSCAQFLRNNSQLDTLMLSREKNNIWGRDIWTTSGFITITSLDGKYRAWNTKKGWFACKDKFFEVQFPLKEMGKILQEINSNSNYKRREKKFQQSGSKLILYPIDVYFDYIEHKDLYKKLNPRYDVNGIERVIKDIILGKINPFLTTADGIPIFRYIPIEGKLRHNVIQAWILSKNISDDELRSYLDSLND